MELFLQFNADAIIARWREESDGARGQAALEITSDDVLFGRSYEEIRADGPGAWIVEEQDGAYTWTRPVYNRDAEP